MQTKSIAGGTQGQAVLIVGHGAVGTAVAARLKLCGFETYFWGRSGPVSERFQFQGWGESIQLNSPSLSYSNFDRIKMVFVAVKAYQLRFAISRVLPLIPKGIPIVSLSNGAVENTLREIASQHGAWKWRVGTCRAGISQIYPKCFGLRSTKGEIIWGTVFDFPHLLEQQMATPVEESIFAKDRGTFFRWSDKVLGVVRRKWFFNCVINTICAAHLIPKNGLLLEMMKIVEPVQIEAYRLGIEMWGDWPDGFSASDSYHELINLICSTAENENSMYRDVRLGRKTENEYLAKIALDYRGYPLLKELSSIIDSHQHSHSKNFQEKPI